MASRTYYDKNGVILSRNDALLQIRGIRFNINWGSGIIIEFWFNIKVALFINCKPRFYYNLG